MRGKKFDPWSKHEVKKACPEGTFHAFQMFLAGKRLVSFVL
jgi:hypothetical protein